MADTIYILRGTVSIVAGSTIGSGTATIFSIKDGDGSNALIFGKAASYPTITTDASTVWFQKGFGVGNDIGVGNLNSGGTFGFVNGNDSFGVKNNAGTTFFVLSANNTSVLGASSGTPAVLTLNPVMNQSGTAGYTALKINVTHTATGSGAKYFLEGQIGGTAKCAIDSDGFFRFNDGGVAGGIKGLSNTNKYLYIDDGDGYGSWQAFVGFRMNGQGNSNTSAGYIDTFKFSSLKTNTSGTGASFVFNAVYNQTSGTAANTDVLISRTNTALGSGAQLILDCQVGGSSVFSINRYGGVVASDVCLFGGGGGDAQFNAVNNGLTTRYVARFRGVSGQTGDLIRAENNGGTSLFTVESSGAVSTAARITSGVVSLTDGSTPALDASLGNTFVLSAAGDRTIAIPTNPTNGQKIVILHHASGGARTLSLNTGSGGFAFGSDVTGLTQTVSGKIDAIGCIYTTLNSLNKWIVVAYIKGF